jgi:hypothetical protein
MISDDIPQFFRGTISSMLQASAISEAFHHLHLSSPTRIAELRNWMMGTPNRETMVFQGKTFPGVPEINPLTVMTTI